jgi:hypothetical protein
MRTAICIALFAVLMLATARVIVDIAQARADIAEARLTLYRAETALQECCRAVGCDKHKGAR